MPDIDSILSELRSHPYCTVLPPSGVPEAPPSYSLPTDFRRFYELAGGAILHGNHKCALPTRILPPSEFQRIDVVITGDRFASGPFEHWFAVADIGDGNYLSIDLHPAHFGLCYDSFHETFAMPGYVGIVATSFADLLSRLLRHPQDSSYWLQEDFPKLGEAFALYGYASIAPPSD
jgi:antitoxin YokJ